MQINQQGLDLIKEFEGCRLEAYLCPANIWTIGYGHTKTAGMGMVITEDEAEALLRDDLREAEAAIDRLVIPPINENQFSALVSFAFNVGAGALKTSTLLLMLNSGVSTELVADQLLRWNKVGDQKVQGLMRRRFAEQALFLSQSRTESFESSIS